MKVGGPLNPLSLPEMRSKEEEMAVEMKVHPVEVNSEAGGGADARFKAKNGSVFPKKKKLVKKMMLDSMVKFFSSLSSSSKPSQYNQSQMQKVMYC